MSSIIYSRYSEELVRFHVCLLSEKITATQSRMHIFFRMMCLPLVDIFKLKNPSNFPKKKKSSCMGLKTKLIFKTIKDRSGILLFQLDQDSHELSC